MIVVLTAEAEDDLESIGDWIAVDNPARAITFVMELRDCCMDLGRHPKAYPIVERFKKFGIRKRSHEDYLVFYRITRGTIEILHVLHGARDYDSILSETSN